MEDTIEDRRKTMMVRLNKIIKIATEAKETFEDNKHEDRAYLELHSDVCKLSAHVDYMFDAISARAYAQKYKDEKKAKKKDKKKKHK